MHDLDEVQLDAPSKTQAVVHCDGNFLLRPEITLGGLDRGVSQQELDLFEIPTAFPAELMGWSAASTQIHLGV